LWAALRYTWVAERHKALRDRCKVLKA